MCDFHELIELFCCSVIKLCPTLCDPMDCSIPGSSVLHCLLESAQTHVHWVSDAIQPSRPLSSPSPPAFILTESILDLSFLPSNRQECPISPSLVRTVRTIHWSPLPLWNPVDPLTLTHRRFHLLSYYMGTTWDLMCWEKNGLENTRHSKTNLSVQGQVLSAGQPAQSGFEY